MVKQNVINEQRKKEEERKEDRANQARPEAQGGRGPGPAPPQPGLSFKCPLAGNPSSQSSEYPQESAFTGDRATSLATGEHGDLGKMTYLGTAIVQEG